MGICTISEVMDTRQVDLLAKYVDILQIGARNMQNFSLLKEVGVIKKAGDAQTRHECDHQGMADVCRIPFGPMVILSVMLCERV